MCNQLWQQHCVRRFLFTQHDMHDSNLAPVPSSTKDVATSIAFYVVASMALTFFNKWFLGRSALHFTFPITITMVQQTCVFFMILLGENNVLKKYAGDIRRDSRYILAICPIGIMCALDWGVSNFSLQYIDLSLYEMIKSSGPLFVLLMAFATGLQAVRLPLIGCILCIAGGTYLAVCGTGGIGKLTENGFPLFGASLCLAGSFFAGARSVLSQIVLQRISQLIKPKEEEEPAPAPGLLRRPSRIGLVRTEKSGEFSAKKKRDAGLNTITVMYYVCPATALSLVPLVLYLEARGIQTWVHHNHYSGLGMAFLELAGSAFVAFCVSIGGFIVTKKTSALTYVIIQLAERVAIVGCAMLAFGDHVGVANALGFGITLSGIGLYNYYKVVVLKREAKEQHDADRAKQDELINERRKSVKLDPSLVFSPLERKPRVYRMSLQEALQRRQSYSSSTALVIPAVTELESETDSDASDSDSEASPLLTETGSPVPREVTRLVSTKGGKLSYGST